MTNTKPARLNATARAMQIVRNQWACAGCQMLLRGKGRG